MPTVRRLLAAGVTTLVLNDHSEAQRGHPARHPLLLEVGLRLTALHRDSMEAVSPDRPLRHHAGGFLRGDRADGPRPALTGGAEPLPAGGF
ncbi:MAG: hypothetical protein ACLUNX_03165 [Angelakisella sp.]